jgi:outer membrane protein TolC
MTASSFRWLAATALLPILIAFSCPPAVAADGLSLSQAIETALTKNPDVLRAREQITEFRQQVRSVRAEALPTLDLTLSATHLRDPGLVNNPSFKELKDVFPPEALEPLLFSDYAWSFHVEQPIYTFGRVSHALKVAHQELRGVQTDARAAENKVAHDVALAYYDVLLARQQLAVLEAERTARERQLETVRARFEIEDATRLDVLSAQVALANLQPRILAADARVNVTQVRLNEVMGLPVETRVDLSDTLGLPDPPPSLPGAADLTRAAADTRPELLRFDISRRGLREAQGVYRADTLPRITGNAGFGIDSYAVNNLKDFTLRNWSVGASLKWTLFDGLRTPATIARLESQAHQTSLQERAFRASLERQLASARGDWERGLKAIDAAEIAVDQAREAQSLAEESLRLGGATVLDVLEAARSLREAEGALATARHGALTALAEIKFLVGQRPDVPLDVPTDANATVVPRPETR